MTATSLAACSAQRTETEPRRSARAELVTAEVETSTDRSLARRERVTSGALESYFWLPTNPATNPGMRDSHAIAYDPASASTVLFSGDVCGSSCTLAPNDTWTWNGTNWTKQNPSKPPAARYWAGMAYDAKQGVVVLYGGVSSSGNDLSDTWTWNGSSWTELSPGSNPGARDSFGMAYDSVRDVIVLFGGEKCSGKNCSSLVNANDTWEWNGTNWTQMTTSNQPVARLGTGMAFDSAHGVAVLFGGTTCSSSCNSVTEYGDTWTWNGTTWTPEAPSNSPSPRDSFGMTYDSARGKTMIYGGFGSSGDTWEWDGSSWTQTTPSPSPPYRYWAPMTFDSARGRAVVFGGTIGTTDLSDTWEYYAHGSGCSVGTQCDTGYCVDGVCCNTSSCGTCQSCDTTNPGVCAPVTNAPDPPSCTGTETCDANGLCKLVTGQPCVDGNVDCANGACVDGYCCDTACTDSCDVCATALGAPANGTCGPAIAGYTGDPPCAGGYVCNGTSDTCPKTCSSDSDCSSGYYCGANGTCAAQKAQGATCSAQPGVDCLQGKCRECASGFCTDGVCCGTACSGSCDVCSSELGATTNGTCSTAPAGYAGSPTCSPYSCSGTSESCPVACTATSGCATGAFCENGVCQGTELAGQACGSNGACVSKLCVDGVCCNSECTGQCEACDVAGSEGTCTPVAGEPHGTRAACPTGTATTPCTAALCDGNTRTSCTAFVGSSVTCVQASCTAGVATLASACDGQGNCPTPQTKDCSPYVCSGTTCKSQCASDADCTGGERCDVATGTCVSGVTCDGDHTITGANGQTTDCSPYTCTAAGCQTGCHSVLDCVSPAACGSSGECVLPSSADAVLAAASCDVARPGGPRGVGEMLSTLGIALAGVARRRRARVASPGGSSRR